MMNQEEQKEMGLIGSCMHTIDDKTYIELQSMGATDLTIKVILKMNINNIVSLVISRNQISNEGLKILSKGNWNKLTMLDLHWNNFDAAGLQYLLKCNLKSMTHLFLSGNNLGKKGLKLLLAGDWPNLKELGLTCVVYESDEEKLATETEMRAALQERFPTAKIMF